MVFLHVTIPRVMHLGIMLLAQEVFEPLSLVLLLQRAGLSALPLHALRHPLAEEGSEEAEALLLVPRVLCEVPALSHFE